VSFKKRGNRKIIKFSPRHLRFRKLIKTIQKKAAATAVCLVLTLIFTSMVFLFDNDCEYKIQGQIAEAGKNEEIVNLVTNKLLQGESGIYNLNLIFFGDWL
jgi:hypothetical protein